MWTHPPPSLSAVSLSSPVSSRGCRCRIPQGSSWRPPRTGTPCPLSSLSLLHSGLMIARLATPLRAPRLASAMSRKMSTNPSMPQIEAMGKHAEKSYKDARAKADGFVLNSASVTTWQVTATATQTGHFLFAFKCRAYSRPL